jgi:hypothetical protein
MQSIEHQELIIQGLSEALQATPDTPEYDHQRERYTELLVFKVITINSDIATRDRRHVYVPKAYDVIKGAVQAVLGRTVADEYLKHRIEQVKASKWLGKQRLVTRLKKPPE